MEINLKKYMDGNTKVLSGREYGKTVRKKLKLDEIDGTSQKLKVTIPEDLYSINSSFFLGLFGPSIRTLGEEKFRERYVFICDPVIQRNIDDGISRALKSSDPLKG